MNEKITRQTFIRDYWSYYIELEEQLVSTKRYVDFSELNNKTFSVEYLKLLQATCGEIDVVAKVLSEYIDPTFMSQRYINIQKWGFVIQQAFPNIENTAVRFNNDYIVIPWHHWAYKKHEYRNGSVRYDLAKGKDTPKWWRAYNALKHERTSAYRKGKTNYVQANLGNVISAMAALYILEQLFLSCLDEEVDSSPVRRSELFKMEKI